MKKLLAVFLVLVLLMTAIVHAGLPIKSIIVLGPTNYVTLSWVAAPGSVYAVSTTTNLLQPWQPVPGQPATFTTTNNTLEVTVPIHSVASFFSVVRLDTQGPQIYQTAPLNNAIGVSQQAVLQAWLQDETGVSTDSIVFAVGTNAPLTLHDPRLAWSTNGVLTYTPGTNEVLGAPGQIVTVSLSAADTLGNVTTNFTWSFQLALPTVLSSSIVFLGSGTNPPASLQLLSTNGNTFTYSYTGSSSGLSNGMQLVNANQTNGYTVTVVSFTQQPTNHTVVVVARPTLLAELLQQGSLVSGTFTEVTSGPSPQVTQLGLPLNYSYPLNQVLYQDGNLTIETTAGSAVNLNAELNITANFSGFSLTAFQATVAGTANLQLDFEALAQAAESQSGTVTLIAPISRTFYGTIGLVPVWLTVVFEVDAGFDASLEAQGQITAGMSASEQILFGKQWNQNTGWTLISQNPGPSFAFQQPAWQIQGSAGLTVYLLPKVTLLVESVAGVTGDLKPYADLNYTFQANPPECNLSLYAGLDSDLALDLTVWDSKWGQLPSDTFHLIPQTLLWQTNCADTAPQIVLQPVDQNVVAGATAVFQVEAQGSEPMTYQWSRGGLPLTDDGRVTGSASATLGIADAQSSDAGVYSVSVSNPYGSTNSTGALLTIVSNNMALIPAGSFTMGDTLDGDSDAIPVSVYVSAFYMDVNLVSYSQWQAVYSYATSHGYGFDNAGAGKAANHPVQTVNWYDVVKWSNGRSQQAGLTPVYYTDAAFTQVYTTGDVDAVYVNWGASGYRLPTEAEWEKAARGGLSGQRFPWGDTISESQANYYGETSNFSYDLGPNGYNALFDTGAYPYTSPVGYFAANGNGLYDMAGNVFEWCWDWYGTPYGQPTTTNPTGPASGSFRVFRGGDWLDFAYYARCAYRGSGGPTVDGLSLGFRCVRGL
jgi:formylglycine-generating enzyme required for sulfatase activity